MTIVLLPRNSTYQTLCTERTNAMLQLVDVPEGFVTANVVPWDPITKRLLPIGRIEHERNG